jgi:cellulose synthase/poly-beta-1,6-N-acetylglucosamine synthase-like glycosyltransferase
VWLAVWAWFAPLIALGLLAGAIALLRRCPQLLDTPLETRASWPRLSVIIPACNEAATLEAAIGSLLAEDYPNLEIVLIDDRSTDGTSELVDRLSARDPRIAPLHIRELPENWLGKVHAMHHGMQRATGEYVLLSDADIHFAPGTLRRSVSRMEKEQLDHFCVFPTIISRSFLVGVCVGSTCRAILALARPWEAVDPRSKKSIGIGAFNMVRRSKFDQTPGFEWLRMEVADDIGVGVMMKQFGGKIGIGLGRELLSVEWYPNFRGVVRGLEKNGFAQAARFRVWRGLLMALAAVFATLAPFVGFIATSLYGIEWAWIPSAIGLVIYFAAAVLIIRGMGGNFFYLLFSLPIGDLLMTYVILRSVWVGKKRGGLLWRGTLYPTEALEKGRRVDF